MFKKIPVAVDSFQINDNVWYTKQPVVKITLSKKLPNICKQAGLRKVYNNHSLRSTSIVCTFHLFTDATDSANGGYYCGKFFQLTCLIQRKNHQWPIMNSTPLWRHVFCCVNNGKKEKNSRPLWQLSNSWNYKQRTFKNEIAHEFNEKTNFHCSKSSFHCTCIYNWNRETEYCSRCYFSFPDGQIPEASSRSGQLTDNLPPLPPHHNVKK